MKLLTCFVGMSLLSAAVVVAQGLPAQQEAAASAPAAFEVASVKPTAARCPPACGVIRPSAGNQGYRVEGATLHMLLAAAYNVTDRQISGGPDWVNSERFDIEAKDSRPHSPDELRRMLQRLLDERFHLKVRRDTRQETVVALNVDKGGAKLPRHDAKDTDYPPIATRLSPGGDGTFCMMLKGSNINIEDLSLSLSRILDRNVIDQTALSGRYDVDLRYAPDVPPKMNGAPVALSADCRDIYVAVANQLGLQLKSTKGPVPYVSIDKVEKPTAN
jgi:uncharacterized protein (TIGR03435 family)